MSIDFTLHGEPVPWARAGRFGKVTFTPTKVREAEKRVGLACSVAMRDRKPTKAPVSIVMGFYRSTKRRVDIDNLAKMVLDGLNGIAWVDDAQVWHMTITKMLGCKVPRTTVSISEMQE